MKGVLRLTVLYGIFAALATAANLACQALVIALYSGPYAIMASIFVGTLAGLPVKYLLEKKYIFEFDSKDIAHDGRLFALYSFMGVFTTALFWGVEWIFEIMFHTDTMRYVGGAIGLIVGYIIKYHLDKRFVFVHREGLPVGVS